MNASANHEQSNGAPATAMQRNGNAGKPSPRAPLAMRIAIAVIAVVALLASIWSAMSAVASSQYDTATAALNANLAAAAGDDADLNQLKASQQQVDDQFQSIERVARLVPTSLSSSITTNADVSRQLSALIDEALNQQHDGGTGGDQSQGQSSDQANQQNTQEDSGLSDEQRQQVEDLIEQNRRLAATASPTASSTSTPSAPSEQSNAKPW